MRTIVICGHPRGGTTWFGNVLGQAEGAYFLDEPYSMFVHQQYITEEAIIVQLLKGYGQWTFAIPELHKWYVEKLKIRTQQLIDFHHIECDTLFIKAPDVLRLKMWHEVHEPDSTLLIRRHPVAIYNSYCKMRWVPSTIDRDYYRNLNFFSQDPLLIEAWHPITKLIAEKYLMDTLMDRQKPTKDIPVHYYEHLCLDPYNQYKAIFDSLGLTAKEDKLRKYFEPEEHEKDPKGTPAGKTIIKNSAARAHAWIHELHGNIQDFAWPYMRRHRIKEYYDHLLPLSNM